MRLEKLENFARACGEIFGVSVIFGVFCSCLFNMMIFEDWNLNYFQIAGMNDILVSAIEFGFYTLFLIGPIFLIYTYSSISNLFFNDIAFLVSRLKLIPVNIQDFVCGYVFALIHSIFLVTFIYILMGFIGIFDSSSISLSKFGYMEFLKAVGSVVLFALLLQRVLVGSAGNFRGEFLIYIVFYGMVWFFYFMYPQQYRWYGYLNPTHVPFVKSKIEGCDKVYVLWIGEKSSVVECWVDRDRKKQRVYVLNSQHDIISGPIFADVIASPPYGRYGNAPPPVDRMTEQERRDFQGR